MRERLRRDPTGHAMTAIDGPTVAASATEIQLPHRRLLARVATDAIGIAGEFTLSTPEPTRRMAAMRKAESAIEDQSH